MVEADYFTARVRYLESTDTILFHSWYAGVLACWHHWAVAFVVVYVVLLFVIQFYAAIVFCAFVLVRFRSLFLTICS